MAISFPTQEGDTLAALSSVCFLPLDLFAKRRSTITTRTLCTLRMSAVPRKAWNWRCAELKRAATRRRPCPSDFGLFAKSVTSASLLLSRQKKIQAPGLVVRVPQVFRSWEYHDGLIKSHPYTQNCRLRLTPLQRGMRWYVHHALRPTPLCNVRGYLVLRRTPAPPSRCGWLPLDYGPGCRFAMLRVPVPVLRVFLSWQQGDPCVLRTFALNYYT